MKNKPGKYDILIHMLADAENHYNLKMEVYGEKDDKSQEERGPKEIVKILTDLVKGTGRNVNIDRFYSSVELAEELFSVSKLTFVGPLQVNRKHIKESLKSRKERDIYSSIFTFTHPTSQKSPIFLVSYIARKNSVQNVVMLSTQHVDDKKDDSKTQT